MPHLQLLGDASVQWVLDQLKQKGSQMNALIYNCLVDASVQWVLDQMKQKSSQMNALIYNCLVDASVRLGPRRSELASLGEF